MKLSNENGSLFNQQEKNFLEHLLYKKRVLTFSMAGKQNQHNGTSKFNPTNGEKDIMNIIKQATYIRSRHIENIISESSKLAIRDYMDQITE